MTDQMQLSVFPTLANQCFHTVCRRVFAGVDPTYFPQARYRGQRVYFCTDACLGAFQADPEVFYRVHHKSEKGKEHVETG